MKRLILLVAACYLLVPAASPPRIRSATSRSTASRGSRSQATGSTSATSSTWPRSRPSSTCRSGSAHSRSPSTGNPSRLQVAKTALAHPRGAAGLQTTRFQACWPGRRSTAPRASRCDDHNYAGRIGWKEIVLGATTRSTSDELRAYPKDLLEARSTVTSANGRLAPNDDPPPTLLSGRALAAPDRIADSSFASLIGQQAPERVRRAHLTRARGLLGRGARALARTRKDDRLRLPRRLARHAVARGTARPDHDRDAHRRCLRARRRSRCCSRSGSSRTRSTPGST